MGYPNDLLVPDDGSVLGFARVRTSAQGPEFNLGEMRETNTGKRYRYVQFKDAVTYTAGMCCTYADATSLTTVTNDISGGTSIGSVCAGVAVGVPAQNGYGWVQTYGLHTAVRTSGADDIAVGESVVVHGSTDGTVDGASASTYATGELGVAVAADDNDANTVAVFIRVW